jgi:zinc-binding domain of primase-helicase
MPANLVDLLSEYGFSPVKKTATEWASPCPFCGGKDRFQIWPDEGEGRGYYWCRQCDAKGDGIQFLRDFADMNYGDACKRIGVAPVANLRAPALTKKKAVEPFEPVRPDDGTKPELDTAKWRTRALDFVTWTSEQLQKAPEQLAWLAARGIDAASARQYRLGYNPGEKGRNCIIRPRAVWGLPPVKRKDGKDKQFWLPRGIVVPQLSGDEVQRLRIRRLDADRQQFRPEHKYHVVEGSSMDVLWLPCTAPRPGQAVAVVVESELDAILLHILAGDLFHCMASMTSNIRRLPANVYEQLQSCLCILVALDCDAAGADGWPRWQETFPRAKRWPVPAGAGKDPGEAFSRGENLRLWLQAGIPAGIRKAMRTGQPPEMASQEEGRDEKAGPVTYHGIKLAENGHLIPPPEVLQFYAMWREMPVVYTRFTDSEGNCIGFDWNCDNKWSARNPGKLYEFLLFRDSHDIIWEWISLNPCNKVTAQNFLNATW